MCGEIAKHSANYHFILGADEVGWGAYAGPIVVCAAIVPVNWVPPTGLNDSKKLRKQEHKRIFYILKDTIPYKVEMAQSEEIDRDGPKLALRRCYQAVVSELQRSHPQALVVIDGQNQMLTSPHIALPKADGLIHAVMAASVIGKYLHDQHMLELDTKYPGYGFATNVGYGTAKHEQAIRELGISPAHRKSYIPKRLSS